MHMSMNRRTFLRIVGVAGAGTVAAVLQACLAPNASTGNTPRPAAAAPTSGSALKLPTYTPITAAKPDLPGDQIVLDGYTKFPATTFKSITETPGKGATLPG
jgi:hypothetical protein